MDRAFAKSALKLSQHAMAGFDLDLVSAPDVLG